MRTIICLNGEKFDFEFLPEDYIIVCDGAYSHTKHIVKESVLLGDFDSLGYKPSNAIVYPVEKDYRDGELAIQYAARNGLDDLFFIYAGGLREDHFMGNLALLQISYKLRKRARLVTANATVYYTEKPISLSVEVGSTISVVAIKDSVIRSSSGLKYEYNNTELRFATTLGISNIALSENVVIDVESGGIFVFVNNK